MSFGVAASTITINGLTAFFFKLFYGNFSEKILKWFVYPDILEFKLPMLRN